ncbi:MAG: N-acyl homoserine lactone hydrolase [Rhodobacteraceae bacterium HLUCCA24]|nr:MAG: N-acyl homoserine lactone hydrolase [Rhodobacteraceae bacterium HLUCCA24]
MDLLKGRPARLTVLDFGLFRVFAGGGRDIGISGYLIETDRGEKVLVDSGFPEKYARDPEGASRKDRLADFGAVLACGPENTLRAQLARAGTAPEEIDLFILTHTHIDHLGGLDDVLQAPMLIGAPERALPRPLYWGDVQPLDWPERPYLEIARDETIGPGFDVFLTPGHAPGQLALMIELPATGHVLLTSDAISRPEEVSERFAGTEDAATALHHAERLLDRADREGAFVIYGHWPRQWPALRKAPDAYL